MRAAWAALAAISLGAAPALAHAGAPGGCRHALVPVAAAAAIPAAVTAPLKWIAFHGERWNGGDARTPGLPDAGFEWAARAGQDWIVAYKVGGLTCCHIRFTLLRPQRGGYEQVIPAAGSRHPDWFGDPSCSGIDAALSAYAGSR